MTRQSHACSNPPKAAVIILAAAMAVGLAGPARGQTPQEDPREAKPERPTVATHAHVVAPGIVELEMGIQFQHPVPGASLFLVPWLFKIGMAKHLQLDIAPGFQRSSTAGRSNGGLTDAQVGIKWQLAEGAPVVGDFALQSLLKLPTGSLSRGTGTGTTDLNLLAISSHAFGPVALDINVGYARRSGDWSIVPTSSTSWTCSAGVELTDRLGWVGEVFGYPGTTGRSGAPAIVAFLTGPTLVVQKSFVIDAGVIFNISGFGGTAAYAGLTWNMGRLWTPPQRLQPMP
jgi:hypothetical protein